MTISSDTIVDIELKKFHTVTFQINNYFSNTVGMAGVAFNNDSLITNAGGNVSFAEVTKGMAYSVQVLANHYLPFSTSINIAGDSLFVFVIDADITAPVAQAATGLNDHGFTAEWTAGTNADQYALFVSDDNFSTYITGYDSAVVTTLSEVITGLTPGATYHFRLRSVNAYGVSGYSNTGTATTTTANDQATTTIILVFPNPATDIIAVNCIGELPSYISVYDAFGRKLIEQPAEAENKIVVSFLPDGIYYLHCGEIVSTFVVKR